ncbi:MAG: hypothetical protein HY372_01095 [Candidatus Andersenbacteria bacterium]|nr:hypothetical protein [Candidatus Andersenbacteria bacterium]
MIEFLKVAAPVMTLVSMVLMLAGLIPSLHRSKVYHFLCGESSFVTAIAYGGLAVLGASSFAPFVLGLWFITGSVKFAHATFIATE